MGQQLTAEQIQTAVTESPELKTALFGSLKPDFMASLKAEGVILRTTEEEQQFLANYEKTTLPTKVQEAIGAKIKEVHDQYDNDLFELTGERKQPNEKTYDFMKRKLNDLKAQAKGAGKDDPVLADQIKDLQTKLKEKENWVSADEVTKLKTQYFKDMLNFRLSNGLDKLAIAIPGHITDDNAKQQFASMQRNMIKVDFAQKFEAKQNEEGKIVFYLDGKIQTDTQTGEPLTEEQLIEKHYSPYLAPKTPAKGGSGSGPAGGSGGSGDPAEADLKNKVEVTEYLQKKGMSPGSAEFNKEYKRIIAAYAITA